METARNRTLLYPVLLGLFLCSPASLSRADDLASTTSTDTAAHHATTKHSFSIGAMGLSIHGFTEEPRRIRHLMHMSSALRAAFAEKLAMA